MEPIGRAAYNAWRQAIAKHKPEGVLGPPTLEWEDLDEWEREAWQEAADDIRE